MSCSGASSNNCLSCDIGSATNGKFHFTNKNCIALCPSDTFDDNNVCKNCHTTCATCSGGSENNKCDTCSIGGATPYYYTDFRTCLTSCPTGSYLSNSVNKICTKCNYECLSCSGGSRTDCSSCDSSIISYKYFFATSKTCTSTCPDGSFLLVPIDTTCLNCHTSCKTCSGGSNSNNCNNCDLMGLTSYYYGVDRTCTSVCPVGSYLSDSANKICSECNTECLTCSAGTRTDCLTCDQSSLSYKYYWAEKKICTALCPEGSYLPEGTGTVCAICHNTC